MRVLAQKQELPGEQFIGVIAGEHGRYATVKVAVPAGPEALWPAIRKIGERGPFTAHDVARACSASLSTVEGYLARLHAGAMVAHVGETTARLRLWQLTTRRVSTPYLDGRGNPSHGHEVASRIWRALRMGKHMSFSALCAALSDQDFPVPRETATLYVNALARAGYLETWQPGKMSGENHYRLVPHMASGPLPPRLMRAQLVFDPNLQAIAAQAIVAEEVRL